MNNELAEVDLLRNQRIQPRSVRSGWLHQPSSIPCLPVKPRATLTSVSTRVLHLSAEAVSAAPKGIPLMGGALPGAAVAHISPQQLPGLTAQTIASYDLLLLEFVPARLSVALPLLAHLRRATYAPTVVLGEFTCANARAELIIAGADAVLSRSVQPAMLTSYCRALLSRWAAK